MASAALSVNGTKASPWVTASGYKKQWKNQSTRRKDIRCEAGSGGGRRRGSAVASWAGEYDLYSLLGVERTSEAGEIRKAYRALQKRCHPDIAGPMGHDLAILLNQVYSVLSDPASRYAYDRVLLCLFSVFSFYYERSKHLEFQGYTGKPIYSRWLGHQAEQRAVFVDEVKCIGCLKCALHANNTFAIESVYGRARVVAQWADSEDKIFDAIKTCPVDCISSTQLWEKCFVLDSRVVERSDLAALEFLMSKQPRGNVRMTGGNNVGVRVANVFDEVKKFQRKFDEMNAKASAKNSQEADLQKKSRTSVMDAVRSISNWLYWQKVSSAETQLSLTDSSTKLSPPNAKKLQEAAAKLKARATTGFANRPTASHDDEEYWTPLLTLPTQSTSSSTTSSVSRKPEPQIGTTIKEKNNEAIDKETSSQSKTNPLALGIPLSMAVISAVVNGSKGRDSSFDHGLQEHIGGSFALEIVNSFELQGFSFPAVVLPFVPPVREGSHPLLMEFPSSDFPPLSNTSLLGQRPYYERLLTTMKKLWILNGSLSFLSLADGFFLLKFTSSEDMEMVWMGGTWFLLGKPFILQRWSPKFKPVWDESTSIPLWVKIIDLPLALWTPTGISRIASYIGIPLTVDSLTAKRTHLTFARVCVQISKDFALPEEIPIHINGEDMLLKVVYDWKPSPCEGCGSLIHPFTLCPSNPNPKPILPPHLPNPREGAPVGILTLGFFPQTPNLPNPEFYRLLP
ncbi:hypothetical protein M5K25_010420 [Dendrobium thyrsiflorum]|uniref:J domain-containing protein n=1 Tax=Dendrobium thyrsiflorum TaxID=117978 RepID=A0ABD0V128_DENTH